MSEYVGATVRSVHGYFDASGHHVPAGTEGKCISDHGTILSVELIDDCIVRVPQALVTIVISEEMCIIDVDDTSSSVLAERAAERAEWAAEDAARVLRYAK